MPTLTPNPNVTTGPTQASGSSHQFTGSLLLSASSCPLQILGLATGSIAGAGSYLGLAADNCVVLTTAAGGGGGGISWDGSTANGVATFKDADEATVESNLTFDGSSLVVAGVVTASAVLVSGNLGIDSTQTFKGFPMTKSYGGKISLGAFATPYLQSTNIYIPDFGMNIASFQMVADSGDLSLSASTGVTIECGTDDTENGVEIVTNYMNTKLNTGSLEDEAEYAWSVEDADGDSGAWLRLDLDSDMFVIDRVPLHIGNVSEQALAGNSYYLGLNAQNQVVRTSSAGGGGGSVAGSNTQVQYNNSDAFGADGNFTYDGSGTATLGTQLLAPSIGFDNATHSGVAQIWTLMDDQDGFGGNGALLIFTGSGGDLLKFSTSGSRKGVVFPTAFYPGTNDSVDMGDSTYGFRNIYCVGQINGAGAGEGKLTIELPNNKNEGFMIRDQGGGYGNHITLGTTASPRINLSQPTVIGADESLSPKITLDVHYSGSGSPTSLANQVGGGEVVYFGTGSLINVGGVHYLNSDGGWVPADSDATGSGHNQLLGIALGTYVSSSGMLVKGYFNVTSSHFVGGFTKGGPVYIYPDPNPAQGKMTGSAPTGSDEYVRVIGYGTDTANVVYFNPDSTYIELA